MPLSLSCRQPSFSFLNCCSRCLVYNRLLSLSSAFLLSYSRLLYYTASNIVIFVLIHSCLLALIQCRFSRCVFHSLPITPLWTISILHNHWWWCHQWYFIDFSFTVFVAVTTMPKWPRLYLSIAVVEFSDQKIPVSFSLLLCHAADGPPDQVWLPQPGWSALS